MNETLAQWLEQNPLGAALAGLSGFLVLIGLALTLLWGGAVGSGVDPSDMTADALPELPSEPEPLGPLSTYQVVNNRPLFNTTRRPIVIAEIIEEPEEEPELVLDQEVSDPPRVRLTGVVITPEARIVTLTPEQGGEALVIRQGMPLEGEYFGWSVGQVDARRVSLRSIRGQSIQVELSVHDRMIAEPPKPQPAPVAGQATAASAEPGMDGAAEPGETRSRADEIRERIRQRREQLREEAQQEEEDAEASRASRQNAYQEAIQSLMRKGSSSANKAEEGEGDDSGDDE